VTVLTTGHEKDAIAVALAATSDGRKLIPYVLLKRTRPIPKLVKDFQGKLVLSWAGTTFMNDPLIEDYLRRVIGGPGPFGKKRLLIWDAASPHKSVATGKILKELKLDDAIIPGGTTKFIQV
jgi:hypothetical protein